MFALGAERPALLRKHPSEAGDFRLDDPLPGLVVFTIIVAPSACGICRCPNNDRFPKDEEFVACGRLHSCHLAQSISLRGPASAVRRGLRFAEQFSGYPIPSLA